MIKMRQVQRLAIVGGNHGNELTGVYLVQKFQQYPDLITRPSFQTLTLLANLQAIAQVKRYIDEDLNRCFDLEELEDAKIGTYENFRAKEIQQVLQPSNGTPVDMIIDLHSTTANMGLCIILGNMHPFLLQLAADISFCNPLVKVYIHHRNQQSGFLRSLIELGLAIEVGAVAQGILDAELFQQTEQLIYTILDYIEKSNQGKNHLPMQEYLTFYQFLQVIDYPRNKNGEIVAMIHPQLHFQDYQPLNPGDPLFLTFTGVDILYQGESTVYPIFINEAAYYEKKIAMYFTQKCSIKI